MNDRIEKSIVLKAPVGRVWRAITDPRQFGQWFRVRIDDPFVPGKVARGKITYPGYEHLTWEVIVQTIEPERYFSFLWHPYAVDQTRDYAAEPHTLVEFFLDGHPDGTMLRIIESGFDKLPPERRDEAFRMNDGGWSAQIENVSTYLRAPSE